MTSESEKIYYHFYNLYINDKLDYWKWEEIKESIRKYEYWKKEMEKNK